MLEHTSAAPPRYPSPVAAVRAAAAPMGHIVDGWITRRAAELIALQEGGRATLAQAAAALDLDEDAARWFLHTARKRGLIP